MTWLVRNVDLVSGLLAEHVWLALVPVVVGLLLALPLGWAATRVPRVRFALLSAAGLLYTVPSLALFVSLPVVLGTQILSSLNIVVALDALHGRAARPHGRRCARRTAPPAVLTAATAMGYRPLRRFVAVELPLAVPVIVAGLRVASVSNISLVTVGSIIGIGGLGELFTVGFQRNYLTPLVVGLVGTLALALVVDAALLLGGRLATPWVRAGVGT
ncbi:MAG: ABC transporter permease subunit [Geodermatophilaceae bacterium]